MGGAPGAITTPVITTWGGRRKIFPVGVVDEDTGQLSLTFGSSSKPSDFIVDTLEAQWATLDEVEKATTELVQLKMDNGPESRAGAHLSGVGFLSCQTHLGSSSQWVRWFRRRPGLRLKAALREPTLIDQGHKNDAPPPAKDTH